MRKIDLAGAVYFLKEHDTFSRAEGAYFKIGRVRQGRIASVETRVAELQTGNPRLLEKFAVVSSPDAVALERTLHARLATSRVSPEWFIFSADEVAQAVALAESLSEEQVASAEQIAAADHWATAEPNTTMLAASQADVEVWRRACQSKRQILAVTSQRRLITDLFHRVRGAGWDLSDFVDVSSSTSTRTDQGKLERDDPGLHYLYQVVGERCDDRLAVQAERDDGRRRVDLGGSADRLHALTGEIKRGIAGVEHALREGTCDFATLMEVHFRLLLLLRLDAEARWVQSLAQAALKARTGHNLGIEGVVVWRRERQPTLHFDDVGFRREEPETARKYEVVTTKPVVKVLKFRRYQKMTETA